MRVKQILRELITAAALQAREAGALAFAELPAFEVEAPKLPEHGDLAVNLAMILASQTKQPTRRNLSPPPGLTGARTAPPLVDMQTISMNRER